MDHGKITAKFEVLLYEVIVMMRLRFQNVSFLPGCIARQHLVQQFEVHWLRQTFHTPVSHAFFCLVMAH